MLPAGKLPVGSRSPALTPVKTSIPFIDDVDWINVKKARCSSSTTSWRSIRCWTFAEGINTPPPVTPADLHVSKTRHFASASGHFHCVACEPSAKLHHPRHCLRIQRFQLLRFGEGSDQPRIEHICIAGPVNLVLEIGRHLEFVKKLGVEVGKQVIEKSVANQDDFDDERNWLRLHGDRAQQAQHFPKGLNVNFPGSKSPLQR